MKSVKYVFLMVFVSLLVISCDRENLSPVNESDNSLNSNGKSGNIQVDENGCAEIADGTIHYTYSNGALKTEIIGSGYDDFGYNYQAHMYNGDYYGDGTKLIMKWNDAWLSNKDCGTQIGREGAFSDLYTPDNRLDRHYGYDTYIGSGAWLTNHWTGKDENGKKFTYFVKIIAAEEGWEKVNDNWKNADGDIVGYVIWGSFAVIQEQETGVVKSKYKSPVNAGLGSGN